MPKRIDPVEKTCEGCSNVFTATTTYQRKTQRFCSHTCRANVMGNGRKVESIERDCRSCGDTMSVLPCHKETKFYCSVQCRADDIDLSGEKNPAWKGGEYRNGQYWKRQARIRDDYTCQYQGCGHRNEGKGTHAHHIVPASVSGDHSLSNLITLCSKHHRELEHDLLKALIAAHPRTTKRLAKKLYPLAA